MEMTGRGACLRRMPGRDTPYMGCWSCVLRLPFDGVSRLPGGRRRVDTARQSGRSLGALFGARSPTCSACSCVAVRRAAEDDTPADLGADAAPGPDRLGPPCSSASCIWTSAQKVDNFGGAAMSAPDARRGTAEAQQEYDRPSPSHCRSARPQLDACAKRWTSSCPRSRRYATAHPSAAGALRGDVRLPADGLRRPSKKEAA